MNEKFYNAMSEILVKELYSDIKSWAIGNAKILIKEIKKSTNTEKYEDVNKLYIDLALNKIKDGTRIRVKCKPSLFGPFLRNHFLSPIIGNHTNLRLGPPLMSQNPIMAVMAQTTSHLKPVGMYPQVSSKYLQTCIYPHDAVTVGMTGLIPEVNDIIKYIPALLPKEFSQYFHTQCYITGTIRSITPTAVSESFKLEDYEVMRQSGNSWFLDATDLENSDCKNIETTPSELWGGLYSSGHIEFSNGELPINKMLNYFLEATSKEIENINYSQNQAGRKEILIFGKGFRLCMDTRHPIYSLHMDVNFSTDYKNGKNKFDRINQSILNKITQICKEEKLDLKNKYDLDFNYNNSIKSFKILESLSAEKIEDPLAIAIRNWHRRRENMVE